MSSDKTEVAMGEHAYSTIVQVKEKAGLQELPAEQSDFTVVCSNRRALFVVADPSVGKARVFQGAPGVRKR